MYNICAKTHVGYVREHNEDGFVVNQVVCQDGAYQLAGWAGDILVAVADGMGGLIAGEQASRIVLEQLATLDLPQTEENLLSFITENVKNEIKRYQAENSSLQGMGTTLTGLICQQHRITVFHIGDSRLYRFRSGFLKQLTQDHTLVELLYSMGKVSAAQMKNHPDKHLLLKCLGANQSSGAMKPDLFTLRNEVDVGDIFLLCSDGLSNLLSHEDIEGIVNKHQPLSDRVDNLISMALQRGGHDNITVAAIERME